MSISFRVGGWVEDGLVEDRGALVAYGMVVVLESPGLMVVIWWEGWKR